MTIGLVEAVVQVGQAETPYLRCGQGPAVLLVTTSREERLRLIELLSCDYRIVAPVPPAGHGAVGGPQAWLRGVLDGLGLARATLAVTLPFAAAAVAVAAERGPDGCTCVILAPGVTDAEVCAALARHPGAEAALPRAAPGPRRAGGGGDAASVAGVSPDG